MKDLTIERAFLNLIDGCYDISPMYENIDSFRLGITNLDYNEDENTLWIYLRRPGLLIGHKGKTIKSIQNNLNVKINIVEVNLI